MVARLDSARLRRRDPDPAIYGPAGTDRKAKDTPARRITTFFTRLDDEGWVYDRPSRVFVVDAAAGATALQRHTGAAPGGQPGLVSRLPRRLRSRSARHETWDFDLAVDLCTVPASGLTDPVAVTGTVGSYLRPAFTLDGSALVALVDPDPRNVPNHGRLVRVPLDGGAVVDLAPSLDRNAACYPGAQTPIPQPDGTVLFTFEDAGAVHVARALPDRSVEVVVGGPRWVGGIDACGDVLAFSAGDDTHSADVYTRARQASTASPTTPRSSSPRVASRARCNVSPPDRATVPRWSAGRCDRTATDRSPPCSTCTADRSPSTATSCSTSSRCRSARVSP